MDRKLERRIARLEKFMSNRNRRVKNEELEPGLDPVEEDELFDGIKSAHEAMLASWEALARAYADAGDVEGEQWAKDHIRQIRSISM